jgi:hypothetical protein
MVQARRILTELYEQAGRRKKQDLEQNTAADRDSNQEQVSNRVS